MTFYEHFLSFEKKSGDQLYALCPFHKEKTPSFTVNTDTSEWYCHGCGRGGKEINFIELFFDVPSKIAEHAFRYWEKHTKMPFPTDSEVEAYHNNLLDNPRTLTILEEFGITRDTITKYKLGKEDLRVVFPVQSQSGQWINLRRYLPPQYRVNGVKEAKCLNTKNLGSGRFYPYDAFKEQEIFIVEGEKDCMSARSQGINAVTGTGGSVIPVHEVSLFKDKDVVLMLDTDNVGQKSTATYLELLRGIAKSVRVIMLPCKDFVDYYTVSGGNIDVWKYEVTSSFGCEGEEVQEVQDVSLVKSEFVENLNMWVRLSGMRVSGVEPRIYSVPTKIRCICKNLKCNRPCPIVMGDKSGQGSIEITVEPRHILQFIESPDSAQDTFVRKNFGCKYVVSEPVDYINAQKVIFQESASFIDGLEESSFEHRYGVYLYTDYRLLATLKYNFEACRITDPRSQQNYYVIRSAETVSNVKPSTDLNFLDQFKEVAKKSTTAKDLINSHYDKWLPMLGIEGRPDLFGALILTYCSVTEIEWQGGLIKGWLDSMVIGDTRTGKSQMVQRFVKQTKMGEYINGENARRTGVIGGAQKFGDSWVITWGAIPMNDRGLLIIDEASGLDVMDIKDLSSTRSSGAVTMNKIVKGEARARTRLLWLSNPRSGRTLSEFYWKGYGAFVEFIPIVEDQARFDLVLSAAREDIDMPEGIDSSTTVDIDPWKSLFTMAWSLVASDIQISNEVKTKVKEVSRQLNSELGGGPLVVGVAVHEKVLRLACAFAVLCGSYYGHLIVTSKHVDYAKEFLFDTLNKPTLAYGEYIREYKRAQAKKNENIEFIRLLVVAHPAIKALLIASSFRGAQFQEVLGLDRTESSQILSNLITRGLLRPGSGGSYLPDKILMEIAKQMEV